MDSNATQMSEDLQMIEIAETEGLWPLVLCILEEKTHTINALRALIEFCDTRTPPKIKTGREMFRFHIKRRGLEPILFLLPYDCSIENEIETCAIEDLIT